MFRVLAIDDQPIRYQYLCDTFDVRWGCRIEDVYPYLLSYVFDAILLDHDMDPAPNGAYWVSRIIELTHTPVIITTTNPHGRSKIQAELDMMDHPYQTIPVGSSAWRERLRSALAQLQRNKDASRIGHAT